MSNYDLDTVRVRCRRPRAVAGCSHDHPGCRVKSDNPSIGAAYAVGTSFAAYQREVDHAKPTSLACDASTDVSVTAGARVSDEFLILPTFARSLETGDYALPIRCLVKIGSF